MPQGSRTPVAVFVAVSSYAVAFAVFVASASVLVAWTYWSNFRRKAGLAVPTLFKQPAQIAVSWKDCIPCAKRTVSG